MFTRDLFYTLCDKYGVELSDQYEKPMLKVDGAIRELVEQDVTDIDPDKKIVWLRQRGAGSAWRKLAEKAQDFPDFSFVYGRNPYKRE